MATQDYTNRKTAASRQIKNLLCAFTDHPRMADESYFQHLCFTLGMAARLFFCSIALIIHGIFPFLCAHTASNKMGRCNKILDDRAQRTCPDKKNPDKPTTPEAR